MFGQEGPPSTKAVSSIMQLPGGAILNPFHPLDPQKYPQVLNPDLFYSQNYKMFKGQSRPVVHYQSQLPVKRTECSPKRVDYSPAKPSSKAKVVPQQRKGKPPCLPKPQANSFLASYKGADQHLVQLLEREVMEKDIKLGFDQIAGLGAAKSVLQEAIILPKKMPQYFKGIRKPWNGILLFGPPGTGKTMIAKAIAAQSCHRFFSISAASFASKWKGESQKLVRLLFEMARFYKDSIVFIDEIDSIAGRRGSGDGEDSRKLKTELLVQMDGLAPKEGRVVVIAATNRPWDLDEALRRRLEKRVKVGLPNLDQRRQLFKICLKEVKLATDVSLDHLAQSTEGYSGADIAIVCRQAAMLPLRRRIQAAGGLGKLGDMQQLQRELEGALERAVFEEALGRVSRSVGREQTQRHQEWERQFGSS